MYEGKKWQMEDAEGIAAFFQHYKPIGKMPYTFIVKKDGEVEQALPLTYVSPGAVNLNTNFIQVAAVGDFRKTPLTVKQSSALVTLCRALCTITDTFDVRGHMETDGASGDPKKDCPGEHLRMAGLRALMLSGKPENLDGVVL